MSSNKDTKRPHDGYEQSDAKIKPMVWAVLSIVVLMAIGVGGMYYYQRGLELFKPENTMSMPVMATPQAPALPLLQIDPPVDMTRFRVNEDSILAGYAWVSKDSGIARIPVERGMELLLKQGVAVSSHPHKELSHNELAQH